MELPTIAYPPIQDNKWWRFCEQLLRKTHTQNTNNITRSAMPYTDIFQLLRCIGNDDIYSVSAALDRDMSLLDAKRQSRNRFSKLSGYTPLAFAAKTGKTTLFVC